MSKFTEIADRAPQPFVAVLSAVHGSFGSVSPPFTRETPTFTLATRGAL